VKQRDIAFTEDKLSYKRMLIDNILDERYYIEQPLEQFVPQMRDPHDMIYFFKSEIQASV
jgi:hypothetical protein